MRPKKDSRRGKRREGRRRMRERRRAVARWTDGTEMGGEAAAGK